MPTPLQEKFEIRAPYLETDDAGNEWKHVDSVRCQYPEDHRHLDLGDGAEDAVFNKLPSTGLKEPVIDYDKMDLVTMDSSDTCFVSTPENLYRGFAVHEMRGWDDLYTMEHVDLFYGEVVGTHDLDQPAIGFAERNNYLDRE